MCIYIYTYIFTPSMNDTVKHLQYAFVLMRWVQQLQALQIFGQIWHNKSIQIWHTNTFKTNNNFPPNLRNFPSSFCIPHPMLFFHGIWSWPFFSTCSAFRMVQAFEQRHTFSPEYLPTSPPPSPAAWVVQRWSVGKGDGLMVVITKIGGGEGMRVAAI